MINEDPTSKLLRKIWELDPDFTIENSESGMKILKTKYINYTFTWAIDERSLFDAYTLMYANLLVKDGYVK